MSNYELSKFPILVYFSQLIEGTAKCQPSPQAIEEDYTTQCQLSPDAIGDLDEGVATSSVREVIERKFKPGLNFVNLLKERFNEMETKPEIIVAVLERDTAIPYQDIVNAIFNDLKTTIIYRSPLGVHHIFNLTDTDSMKKSIESVFSNPHLNARTKVIMHDGAVPLRLAPDRRKRKMQTLRVLQASGRNPCNCTL